MQLPDPEGIGFRYPHQVSGGQLPARDDRDGHVLPARPDHLRRKPTTALDVTTQIEVLAAIRDIVRQFDTACDLHHP